MRLTLHLNHACNLRCSYCYGGSKFDRRMGPGVMERALDLAFTGIDGLVRVAPFGGEPLMEMELLEAMVDGARARARRTGTVVRFTMTTNGTLLGGSRLDFLERNRFELTVSLDGDRLAHDAGRVFPDGSGSFDAVVDGIVAARRRLGNVRTVSVVHPGNVDRVGASLEFITGLGVTQLAFVPELDSRWSEEDTRRLEDSIQELADAALAGYRSGRDLMVQPLHDKIVSRLKSGYCPSDMCNFGSSEITVAPSGRIYPCDRLVGEDGDAQQDVVIGHVDSGVDAQRVWALKRAKETPRPDCEGCAILDRCTWWCGCANRAQTGSVAGVSDFQCRIEQAAVRAADGLATTLYAEKNPPFMRRYYEAAAAVRRPVP